MIELMAGLKTETAFIRLPLQAPQVTQLTATGPYGEVIDMGQSRLDETILNVSVLSGFTYGDTPENGMAFIVTARNDAGQARRLCRELAEHTWAERHRFVPRLTSLDDCIRRAVEVGEDKTLPPIIIADVADNPGGGGRGNTTWLLHGLLQAGAKEAIVGVFFDAALAAEAHTLGVGKTFSARFNRDEASPYSKPFEAEAEVLSLSSGEVIGRPGGTVAGRTTALGLTAALDLGGVTVVVVSKRIQCFDSGFFETFGVDVGIARIVVVKSRGHFRAGFAHLFKPEQVIEADAPGLTSPNLANFSFTGYRRPIFPLDAETIWQPPDW
jgi:microcystin degradation protein MlrC